MANISLYRGGTAEFRPAWCCGDYPEFKPPFDTPHFAGTPPFDSHADAARGQGYLNLMFPLVPNLLDTTAHRWMHVPLQKLSAVDDIIQWAWVPHRGYVDSLYMELTRFDTALDGVYVQPVAQRAVWNFTTSEWEFPDNTQFDTDISTAANVTRLPLGTPASGDKPYLVAKFAPGADGMYSTFGHNLVERNAAGEPVGGLDEYYGATVLGLKIVAGDADKIKLLWRSKFELWMCAKFIAYECFTFTG